MSNNNHQITSNDVKHVATLANIPVTDEEAKNFTQAFSDTLAVIDHLAEVDTSKVEPTYQVTGLENIWREDEVDESRMFSQDQALANTQQKHAGYFVVKQIIEQD